MIIYLLTKNAHKKNEVINIFKGYGINIVQKPSFEIAMLDSKKEDITNFITIREETSLIKDGVYVDDVNSLKNLDSVIHKSLLSVNFIEKSEITNKKQYISTVEGFIDLDKKTDNSDVYNWDNIFVELESMKTYNEKKIMTNKFSARTKSISLFIDEITKFKNKIDLKFNPMNQDGVLSFSDNINVFIDSNKYLSYYKKNKLLKTLVRSVQNEGLFTRSAINKNQRNYWYPSLNAGLPLVPKKDEIHEITFMFHDLMHHIIPDLILDGIDTKSRKEAYIIHRMLSESITIVLADMIFVDQLVSAGYEYEWSKRKIYPIYNEFKKNGTSLDRIKKLILANVNFALLGDDSELIKLSNKDVVNDYKNKYEKFFIEDYRWTLNNYECMVSSKESINKWNLAVSYMLPKERLVLKYAELIEGCTTYKEKVYRIFDEVWSLILLKNEENEEDKLIDSVSKSFKNYMVGQLYIFFKYEQTEESIYFFNKIKNELLIINKITKKDIERIRSFYNLYVEKLNKRNIISKTEYSHYIEIFPLFHSFFVFYDNELEYKSIKDVLNKLILKND